MRRISLAFLPVFLLMASLSSLALAQPPGDRGGRGDRGGPPGGFDGGGPLGLLQSEEVRNELQLVDDQVEQLRRVGEDMRDEFRSVFEGMRDVPAEERQARFGEIREKMDTIRKEMEEKLSTVLLPHQLDRLNQINVQMDVQRRGMNGALERGSLAEKLNLSDEDKQKLQEKAAEVQEDLQKKINELRLKAQDEVLSVLSAEQRATYKKLIGEPFTMQNQGFDRRGPGGEGDRPGGDREGGDRGNRRPE